MTVAVRHATQTALPDSGDGKVSSNAWNEAHAIEGLGTMAEADAANYYTAAEVDAGFMVAGAVTQYTDEMARDAVGTALVAGSNITITVDDPGNTITIAASGGGTPTSGLAVVAVDGGAP